MKKGGIILIFVMVLTLACAVLFCACNDRENEQKEQRQRAENSLVNSFMTGINQDWNADLTDEQISKLDGAGEYVVTLGWTRLVCSVIGQTSMQTEKILALSDALASDDAKKMFANFQENAELIIPILKETGLTSTDIGSIVNGLMRALVQEGESVLGAMMDRLSTVKELSRQNPTAFDNINAYIANVNVAISTFAPTRQEKENMLAAFKDAENAVNYLVDFAYGMSIENITRDLFDSLFSDDGALANVSSGELSTLVNAMLLNVSRLKDALGEQEIEKLNVALDIVIKKFDTNSISSAVYAQIVKYAKYAYMIVDIIPAVCDVAVAGGDILSDADFLGDLKRCAELKDSLNKDTNNLNTVIIAARVIENVMRDFSSDSFSSVIDRIGEQSVQEYQKAVPLMAFDLILNYGALADTIESGQWHIAHGDVMDENTILKTLATVLFFNKGVDNLKEAYYKFNRGEITVYALRQSGDLCSFSSFGVENPYSAITQTDLWYNYYMTIGINAVNESVAECTGKIVEDLKLFVRDYYNENSSMRSAAESVADWQIFEQNADETAITDEYYPLLKESGLLGVLILGDLF